MLFRSGGFALPLETVGAVTLNGPAPGENPQGRLGATAPTLSATSADGRGTALQPLLGFNTTEWDTRLDDTTERRHVAAPYHATPVATTNRQAGAIVLAALSWAGNDRAASVAWRVVAGAAGDWKLNHPKLGDWSVRHWSLPALP